MAKPAQRTDKDRIYNQFQLYSKVYLIKCKDIHKSFNQ